MSKNYIHYIHIDSAQRAVEPVNIYGNAYNLPPNPLHFTNGSTKVMVDLVNQPFQIDDHIILSIIISKNIIMDNILAVKKNSFYVRIMQNGHGLSLYDLYDPNSPSEFEQISYVDYLPRFYHESDNIADWREYYILKKSPKLEIQLSGIKGSNWARDLIGNIPTNFLNKTHLVYLIFSRIGQTFVPDPNSYLIKLDKKSSINYVDGVNFVKDRFNNPMSQIATNTIHIRYNDLYGVPLALLNSTGGNNYLTVVDTLPNAFVVDLGYPAIVDPNTSFYTVEDLAGDNLVYSSIGGGDKAIVRLVVDTTISYPNPSTYTIQLEHTYKNIIQAELVGSVFPNSQQIINNTNNKLYWRNLDDGSHIYQLAIDPGNYSPLELAETINQTFLKVPKHQEEYEKSGYPQYHLIHASINTETNLVSFASYGQIIQQSSLTNPILIIPDTVIQFTTASVIPFNPLSEILFIYFTPRSHIRINQNFNNDYFRLYQYTKLVDGATFLASWNFERAVITNFRRTKIVYPIIQEVNEITSINTQTHLSNFNYEPLTKQVSLPAHNLKIGDLIITDQFSDFTPTQMGEIFVYEINQIIDSNKFSIKKYNRGEKYHFLYDGITINFATDSWQDQDLADQPINAPSLSFLDIEPQPTNKDLMIVYHPAHQLEPGNIITINGSASINGVPANTVNNKHTIDKILDENSYMVKLDTIPNTDVDKFPNVQNHISIKYPTIFQLLFDFDDTLGPLLNFDRGTTAYAHCITNNPRKKLNLTGDNYFYLCSPQLGHIRNTKPVSNVFAIIRWTENPNTVVFDSYVPTVKIFDAPLSQLSELSFSIYQPNGQLVDFNGLDHSFTIKITTSYNQINNMPTSYDQINNMQTIMLPQLK